MNINNVDLLHIRRNVRDRIFSSIMACVVWKRSYISKLRCTSLSYNIISILDVGYLPLNNLYGPLVWFMCYKKRVKVHCSRGTWAEKLDRHASSYIVVKNISCRLSVSNMEVGYDNSLCGFCYYQSVADEFIIVMIHKSCIFKAKTTIICRARERFSSKEKRWTSAAVTSRWPARGTI